MSKSKSVAKAPKSGKGDALTKVKDAAVTKSGNNVKSKSKEIAKQVATKEGKKDKKKKIVKEPTPEPSESEESESSESEESASEVEEELTKPGVNGNAGKANGSSKADVSSDESESESDSSDGEAPKVNGAQRLESVKATEAVSSEESDGDESDSASEEDSEDSEDSSDESSDGDADKPATMMAPKIVDSKKREAKEDSEGESDDSEEDEEDDPAGKTSKRKAEDEVEQVTKKSKTDSVDTSKGSNLFIGNLSWNVDEAWLRETFESHGELKGVRLMTDRNTGRSKGFGYVEFVNAEDAANAYTEKQGYDLDGRPLNVDFANARPDNSQKNENRRKSYGDQRSAPSDTLFLGNLAFGVGQETVTEAFQPHGTILGIRLPTDRETGEPKGFGYITFASVDEAKVAIDAMDGAYIEGRPVRLDFSQPRPQNGDSPARGRGGFGGRGGGGGFRGGRGGRGGSFGGGRGGGRGGARGGTTNRGGFGDFSGKKTSFD